MVILRPSYIWDARFLKVNCQADSELCLGSNEPGVTVTFLKVSFIH